MHDISNDVQAIVKGWDDDILIFHLATFIELKGLTPQLAAYLTEVAEDDEIFGGLG